MIFATTLSPRRIVISRSSGNSTSTVSGETTAGEIKLQASAESHSTIESKTTNRKNIKAPVAANLESGQTFTLLPGELDWSAIDFATDTVFAMCAQISRNILQNRESVSHSLGRGEKVTYAGIAGTDDVTILRNDVATISTFLWLCRAMSSPTLFGSSSYP